MIYFAISLITFLAYTVLKFLNGLSLLGKAKFNLKKYYKDIIRKENILTFELLGLVIIILAFSSNTKVTEICMLVLYGFLFIIMIRNFKNKLLFDKRSKSICLLMIIIYAIVLLLIGLNIANCKYDFYVYENYGYYYSVLIIMTYSIYYIIYALFWIIDLFVKTKNKKKA